MSVKLVAAALFALIVVASVSCAPQPADEKKEGCEADGKWYAVGEKWNTDGHHGCREMFCTKSGRKAVKPCPAIAAKDCKKEAGDPNQLHPGCCPKLVC